MVIHFNGDKIFLMTIAFLIRGLIGFVLPPPQHGDEKSTVTSVL